MAFWPTKANRASSSAAAFPVGSISWGALPDDGASAKAERCERWTAQTGRLKAFAMTLRCSFGLRVADGWMDAIQDDKGGRTASNTARGNETSGFDR